MRAASKLSKIVASDMVPGQRLDPFTGEIQPWYTHSALDEIQEWDLLDRTVLEWGGGSSTLWWARRTRCVFTIDHSSRWCRWISAQALKRSIKNITVLHRPLATCIDDYAQIPKGCVPNITIIDGAMRLECLTQALTLPRPVTIIFDNWQQENAFISIEAETLMRPFLGVSYAQPNPAPEQNPWQTAVWHLTS